MPQPSPVPGAAGPPPFFPWEAALPIPGTGRGRLARPQPTGRSFYVRVGGSNNNGGSSPSLAAERGGTDGVTSITTFTSATGNFTQADVGKGICFVTLAGLNRYQRIVAVTNSTTITLDTAAAGNTSGVTWNIGGAWADPTPLNYNSSITVFNGGDSCYIGAGTYRALLVMNQAMSAISGGVFSVIGDVDGTRTGDAGMVQITAYLTNDKTTPSATTLLNLNGKSNLSFQNIMFVGGTTALVTASTPTSQFISFRNCSLIGHPSASTIITTSTKQGVPFSWIIDRCFITGGGGALNASLSFATTNTGTIPYDVDVTLSNCLIVGTGNVAAFFQPASGASGGNNGGCVLRNCTYIGQAPFVNTAANNSSTTNPVKVYGCLIIRGQGTALNAGVSGQIVEDNNLIIASTPRANVSVGARSIADSSYAPLLHLGQEVQWGGNLRPFGEPMQSSPLRAFGAPDTGAGPLDVRGAPRPSSPSQWDVGAFQRANTAVPTQAVTQAGSNAIQITGNGSHDFDVPVDATATSLSIYLRYDSGYVGPLPQVQVVKGGQVGVGDVTVPVSTASLNTFAQYTVAINPTAAGIVTLRIVSGDTSGVGNVYADTFAVA